MAWCGSAHISGISWTKSEKFQTLLFWLSWQNSSVLAEQCSGVLCQFAKLIQTNRCWTDTMNFNSYLSLTLEIKSWIWYFHNMLWYGSQAQWLKRICITKTTLVEWPEGLLFKSRLPFQKLDFFVWTIRSCFEISPASSDKLENSSNSSSSIFQYQTLQIIDSLNLPWHHWPPGSQQNP